MVLILGVVVFNIYLVLSGSESRVSLSPSSRSVERAHRSSLAVRADVGSPGSVPAYVDGRQAEGSDLPGADDTDTVPDPRYPYLSVLGFALSRVELERTLTSILISRRVQCCGSFRACSFQLSLLK